MTTRTPEITVAADPAALYRVAAGVFQRASAGAVAARDVFRVALSGGSTPKGLYSLLASDETLRSAIA